MADISQSIVFQIEKDLFNSLKGIEKTDFLKEVAGEITKINIGRIEKNKDVHGRNFGRYNEGYDKRRAYKYATTKGGQSSTSYKSTSKSKKLRLTGQLLSSIFTESKGTKRSKSGLLMRFKMGIHGSRNQLIAENLYSTTGTARNHKRFSKKSWEFLGLMPSDVKLIQQFIAKRLKKKEMK